MLENIPGCSGASGGARSRRGKSSGRAWVAMAAMVAITALLAGCGLSPGMTAPSSVTQAKAATDAARTGGNNGDQPPAGALVEINNELVAKEAASRPTSIPTDV